MDLKIRYGSYHYKVTCNVAMSLGDATWNFYQQSSINEIIFRWQQLQMHDWGILNNCKNMVQTIQHGK